MGCLLSSSAQVRGRREDHLGYRRGIFPAVHHLLCLVNPPRRLGLAAPLPLRDLVLVAQRAPARPLTCRKCTIGNSLEQAAPVLPGCEKQAALALAGNWHERCEGKDCDCECERPQRRLLFLLRVFRKARSLCKMVYGVLFQVDCPDCNAAQLEPYGAKWRCPGCHYQEPCCTTDCPADGRP